ncbi:PREDICTED: protein TIFY 5A-like [Nicotiana attenuata]|uniref:Protein TIFY n=1 Tax=Nicotiana attenuata TaxID=49451 RepID=I3WTA4_NICAT|nr:PREDICTED: protein TIFY 5A-like [Nicotiana attenuata]AFL46171.1 jasmonate ZIM domain protein f [Nicotiana attenuata]OIT32863.1 protein tify 5a [Nicotiana attenuata]
MRRNCNLELRLVPPCVSVSPKDCTTTPYFSMRDNQGTEEKQQQQLTIFYNGKVVVSDATELQAKAIIYLASRETEENTKTSSPISESSSPLLQTQTGLSMKKSLQRFLQKRKNRIQETSPYHH